MLGVDQCADAGVGEEIGFGILLGSLGFVENDSNINAPLVSIDNRFRNWSRGERIRLDQNVAFGVAEFLDDCLRAAAIRRKVDADVGWIGEGRDGEDERQDVIGMRFDTKPEFVDVRGDGDRALFRLAMQPWAHVKREHRQT